MREYMRIVEGKVMLPTIILPAQTILYHGTESSAAFDIPRGPAWFTRDEMKAARWAGWQQTTPINVAKGRRRVLVCRTRRDLRLYDARSYDNFLRLAAHFIPDEEPEDASPWELARRVRGADGWDGRNEILIRNTTYLVSIAIKPVHPRTKSFGDA